MLAWNAEPQPEASQLINAMKSFPGFEKSKHQNASVAICILGLQRTFTTSYVLGHLKRNLLDRLPADVFLLSSPEWQPTWWAPHNYSLDSDPRFNTSLESALNMIQPVFASTKSYVSWNISQDVLRSSNCSKNGITNWFWVEKCLETVSLYEEYRGYKYDWIMRFRTDSVLREPVDFDKLSQEENATYSTFASWTNDEGTDDAVYISGRSAAEHSFRVIDLYRSCLPETIFDDRPDACVAKRNPGHTSPWNFPNCALRASLVFANLPVPKMIGTKAAVLVRPCFYNFRSQSLCPDTAGMECCVPNGTYDVL